jgi:predicted GNAT family acetyltransferase
VGVARGTGIALDVPGTAAVIDNVEKHRFELVENGLTVFADYRQHDNRTVIVHVEADLALRGTGAAGRLMAELVALAREKKLQIVPRCAYAVVWFKRHPDATDVLE